MNEYLQIADMPTSVTAEEMREWLERGVKGVHESTLRSFQILERVKHLLAKNVDPEVIMSLIEIMETYVKADPK